MKPTGYACPRCDLDSRPLACDIDMDCRRISQAMFSRDDLVRTVLAQQWALAVTYLHERGGEIFERRVSGGNIVTDGAHAPWMDHRSAVVVVAEMLGEA